MMPRPTTATKREITYQVIKIGRGGRIRTCGLSLPKRAHYQAVLRPVCFNKETIPRNEF